MTTVVLYGSPMSLYTGRVRSYLIKNRIDYREVPPISEHYENHVLPAAGGRRSMPTIELADGAVIRDSVAALDHFEAENGGPNSPDTPLQRLISCLLDVIGAEGMMRPAMHYRWHFPENEKLVRFQFSRITPINPPWEYTLEGRMTRLPQACIDLGAGEENYALVESLYLDLLRALDAHLAEVPYLLGGRPCIGDFGLIAPMYGHLGRDLKPLSLMHENALWVLRWVERMHRPEPDTGDYPHVEDAFLPDDMVPDTLVAVMKQFAVDFVPETLGARDAINTWLDSENPAPGTEVVRVAGTAEFEVDGQVIHAAAQPFRFYLLARFQAEYAGLEGDARDAADVLLKRCGMGALVDAALTREIGRENNLEVWR